MGERGAVAAAPHCDGGADDDGVAVTIEDVLDAAIDAGERVAEHAARR